MTRIGTGVCLFVFYFVLSYERRQSLGKSEENSHVKERFSFSFGAWLALHAHLAFPRVCLVLALRLPLLVWKTWKDEARSACYQDVGHDFISIRSGKRTVWKCVSVFMDVKSMYCVGRKTFYMNMHGCGTHSQWLQKKKQKWQRTIWEPSNKKKHVRIVLW